MSQYLEGYEKQVCGHCNLKRTKEGHDGCIGTLKGVMNACCGHGETKVAYVQFDHENYDNDPNLLNIKGQKALDYINQVKQKQWTKTLR